MSDDEYPFVDRWWEYCGEPIHYVDEGEGVPVVLLHGNPTWSFLYRRVIRLVRDRTRAIAVDFPGFGFSARPAGYMGTPQEHAACLEGFIENLQVSSFILVGHDWGGPIGLSVATQMPERIRGMVLMNTWCWSPDWWLRGFSLLMGGAIGRWLIRNFNFFARVILPMGVATRSVKTKEWRDAYAAAFPDPEARMVTYQFPRSIRTASDWLEGIENRLNRLQGVPTVLVWGRRDPAFGFDRYVRRWQRLLPNASVTWVNNASHYVPEDRPDVVGEGIGILLVAR